MDRQLTWSVGGRRNGEGKKDRRMEGHKGRVNGCLKRLTNGEWWVSP